MPDLTTGRGLATRAGALLRAGHGPPSAAVTLMLLLLAVRAPLATGRVLLVVSAVGLGQLSIGWLNDWWDADGDRRTGRSDKPIVTGAVTRRSVGAAAVIAGVSCVAMSGFLGIAGVVNLVHVAAGYVYDVWAKRTRVSVIPYIVAFGLLPAVPTLAGAPPVWPPVWMMLAGASLGIGGHFANALPDLEQDAELGVRGLPQSLGFGVSLAVAAVSLGAGALVAAVGVLRGSGAAVIAQVVAVLALVAGAMVLAAVIVTARRGERRLAFRLTMLLAIVVVAMLLIGTPT